MVRLIYFYLVMNSCNIFFNKKGHLILSLYAIFTYLCSEMCNDVESRSKLELLQCYFNDIRGYNMSQQKKGKVQVMHSGLRNTAGSEALFYRKTLWHIPIETERPNKDVTNQTKPEWKWVCFHFTFIL